MPHARRPGRRGRLRSARRASLPRRPGRRRCSTARLHWFVAHLVARRSWWRGRGRGGDERPVARRLGRRAPGPPRRRRARRPRRAASCAGRPLEARRRLPTGTHVPHPASHERRVARCSSTSTGRRRCASMASDRRGPPPVASASEPGRAAGLAWSSGPPRYGPRPCGPGSSTKRPASTGGASSTTRPVGPDDVRVRVVATALNHMDLWVTGGCPKPPLPHVPGCDVAGVVERWGRGSRTSRRRRGRRQPDVSPPDEVVAHGIDAPVGAGLQIVGEHRWGGHADLVVVPGRNVVPRPSGRSWAECAAYPVATLTAWRMLRRARVQAGETVLVVGIGGGVTTAAWRWPAASARRCYVTSRDEAKRRRAVEAGAAEAFDSGADWPVTRRRRGRERRPRHLGPVGPGPAARWPARGVRRHVRPQGRAEPAAPVLQADRDHRVDHGLVPRVRPRDPAGRADLPVQVDEVFDRADYPAALERLRQGEQLGKVVLRHPS